MPLRDIILIDEDKCDGCGLCIPSCPEGALEIIDGKAKLVAESYCDGMGACVGECPQDAMTVIKREAPEFDEVSAMENMKKAAAAAAKAESAPPPQFSGCPGSRAMVLEKKPESGDTKTVSNNSELTQWPVQLHLVSPYAPYFQNKELLIAADCVPFANPNFHSELLKGKSLVIACPKLDDVSSYAPKIAEILKSNHVPKITVAVMVVPCCSGLVAITQEAIQLSGKEVEMETVIIGVDGETKEAMF
jgi:ferredoxin